MKAHDATNTTVELRSGRSMPALGLGTWELTQETATTVETALALGYRMIDTSGDYGTQPGIAEALRRSHVPRTAVYLVTKVEEDEETHSAARDRIEELGVQRADLILIHRPGSEGADPSLWRGLQAARDEGLTNDIGVSNYSIDQIRALVDATGEVPVVNQVEWTPFGWSQAMLDYCRQHHIVIQAYSPLTRARRLDDRVLTQIAASHGKSPAAVLIRWNLQLGTVPIPKANQKDHLSENLDVFDFELDDDEMQQLSERNEWYSALGPSLQYR